MTDYSGSNLRVGSITRAIQERKQISKAGLDSVIQWCLSSEVAIRRQLPECKIG